MTGHRLLTPGQPLIPLSDTLRDLGRPLEVAWLGPTSDFIKEGTLFPPWTIVMRVEGCEGVCKFYGVCDVGSSICGGLAVNGGLG